MKQISQDTHTAETCCLFSTGKSSILRRSAEKLSKKMLFLTRGNKFQIVKPSYKFLFTTILQNAK